MRKRHRAGDVWLDIDVVQDGFAVFWYGSGCGIIFHEPGAAVAGSAIAYIVDVLGAPEKIIYVCVVEVEIARGAKPSCPQT